MTTWQEATKENLRKLHFTCYNRQDKALLKLSQIERNNLLRVIKDNNTDLLKKIRDFCLLKSKDAFKMKIYRCNF